MNKRTKILLLAMIVSLSVSIMPNTGHFATNETAFAIRLQREKFYHLNEEDAKSAYTQEYRDGWVIADCVNIRRQPSMSAGTVGHSYFNKEIDFYNVNKDWARVMYKGKTIGYMNRKYISKDKPACKMYDVPYTNGNKTYMPYKVYRNGKYCSIFSSSSKQYKLQKYCHTGDYRIRKYKDRFCVALGSAFGVSIGQYFDLCLENGEIIPCIMADQKADRHTDASNIITLQNGCMSEFIIDNAKLDLMAKRMGDISYCTDRWKSRVVQVKVYNKSIEL